MKKHHILIGTSITLALAILFTVGVFAFFRITSTVNRHIGTNSTDEAGRVPISAFADLFSYSVSPHYNNDSEVSTADTRHTLYLTADVTLENNIFISSDVHIDLNGHTLYLNGHTLTLTHAYHGTAVVSNGKIAPYNEADTPVAGKVVFDTPHAKVTLDRVSFVQNDLPIADTFTRILWQSDSAADEKYALYNTLYTLADALVSPYDQRPARLCYDEVQALDTLDLSSVLPTHDHCALGNTSHTCVLASRDLDLPFSYLATDVTITYSSDSAALSDTGNLLIAPDASTAANLTVTVQCNHTTLTDSILVHLYNESNPATALKVATTLFYARIAGHYNDSQNLYIFNRGVHLPAAIAGATFDYHLFENADEPKENVAEDIFTSLSEDIVNFEPTSDSCCLQAILTCQTQTITLDIPMRSGNTGIITTNSSLAQNLTESWYGGRLVITPLLKEPEQTVIGYNPVNLFPHTPDLLTKYGITDVRYELMNNTNDVYEIVGGTILKVKSGKDPSLYVQGVMLNCIFSFQDTVEEIQKEIYYDHLGTGNNVNEFLPYYTYFNELLYGELAGVTTSDFSLPFSYSDTGPFICYDVRTFDAESDQYVLGVPSFLHIALYYDGAIQHTFNFDGSVSMTELLDAYLANHSLSLSDIVSKGDAAWHFILDSENIPHTNTAIDLVYHYKMTADIAAWLRYPNGELEPATSALYIAGILHQAEDDIPDANLYAWIYNTFNITGDTYAEGKYIVVDWLLQNIRIDYTDQNSSFPSNADLNFKGLEFLAGVKYLNLSSHPALQNAANAGNAARAIAQLTNLETLILSGNAFRDRDDATSADNDTVSRFAALDHLRLLYLDDNDLFGFEWLLGMDSLEKVYVFNNSSHDDFTSLVKIFYGSEGLVNLQTFKQLTDIGVAVYNLKSDNNYILFEDVADINDYIRLTNVEYQKKLAVGADIRTLYVGLSTDYSDYSLSTSYEGVNSAFTHNISFSYVGDDPNTATAFILTDNISVGNQIEVAIVILFEIIRV